MLSYSLSAAQLTTMPTFTALDKHLPSHVAVVLNEKGEHFCLKICVKFGTNLRAGLRTRPGWGSLALARTDRAGGGVLTFGGVRMNSVADPRAGVCAGAARARGCSDRHDSGSPVWAPGLGCRRRTAQAGRPKPHTGVSLSSEAGSRGSPCRTPAPRPYPGACTCSRRLSGGGTNRIRARPTLTTSYTAPPPQAPLSHTSRCLGLQHAALGDADAPRSAPCAQQVSCSVTRHGWLGSAVLHTGWRVGAAAEVTALGGETHAQRPGVSGPVNGLSARGPPGAAG